MTRVRFNVAGVFGFALHAGAFFIAFLVASLVVVDVPASDVPASDLPGGFAPSDGRMALSIEGREVALNFPATWAQRDDAMVVTSGKLTFRLQRSADGSSGHLTVLDLGEVAFPVDLHLDVTSREWVHAEPRRYSSRTRSRGHLLSLDGAGHNVARGLYLPDSGVGLDLGGIWSGFVLSKSQDSDGRITIEGQPPRGREVALWSWRLIPPAKRKERITLQSNPRVTLANGGLLFSGGDGTRAILSRVDLRLTTNSRRFFVEIADGWPARGGSLFKWAARDWRSADASSYPGGLKALTAELSQRGIPAGLWLAPYGYSFDADGASVDGASGDAAERAPAGFVRDGKGKPVSEVFLGQLVVDPTSAAGLQHLRESIELAKKRGFRFVRLGGLGAALRFFELMGDLLESPSRSIEKDFRRSFEVLREAAGDDLLLLGDSDTPALLHDLLDGVRPEWDFRLGIEPLRQDIQETQRWASKSRSHLWVDLFPLRDWIVQGNDVDRMRAVRSRVAYSLLCGKGNLLDAKMSLMPEERVELAWAQPSDRVRTIDQRSTTRDAWRKGGADLRIVRIAEGSAARPYCLVGMFSTSEIEPQRMELSALDLGGERLTGKDFALFEVREETLVNSGPLPYDTILWPRESRVFAVHETVDHPQLIAVSGHYLAQAMRISQHAWNPEELELTGKLQLAREELRLYFVAPRKYSLARCIAVSSSTSASVSEAGVKAGGTELVWVRENGVIKVSVPPGDGEVRFSLGFRKEKTWTSPERELRNLHVAFDQKLRSPFISWERVSCDGSSLTRDIIYRDGEVLGQTTGERFVDLGAERGASYLYEVLTEKTARRTDGNLVEVLAPGPISVRRLALRFKVPSAEDSWLDDWAQVTRHDQDRQVTSGVNILGGPLSVRGARTARGIGMFAPQRAAYRLEGLYSRFEAKLAIDDAARLDGSAVFIVKADGRELYRSPVVTANDREMKAVSVSIKNVQLLELSVEAAQVGDRNFADWIDARVLVNPKS